MSDFANERTCVCGETFIADGFDMCDDCVEHEETCESDNCDHPSHPRDTRLLAEIRDSIKFPTRW